MNADHRRHVVERRSIERERVGQPSIVGECIGKQQLAPRTIVRAVVERGHRVLRDGVVSVSERVPAGRLSRRDLRDLAEFGQRIHGSLGRGIGLGEEPMVLEVGRLRGNDRLQRRDRFCRFAHREVAGSQQHARVGQFRIQRERTLERRHRLGLVPSHRQRHPEVREQLWFVRRGLQQFPIDRCGLVIAMFAHRARRFGRACAVGCLARTRLLDAIVSSTNASSHRAKAMQAGYNARVVKKKGRKG